MPNFDRIRELRDFLKSMRETKHRQFRMQDYIQILALGGKKKNRKALTVKELRDNGPECASAACLAGWAVIHFGADGKRFRIDNYPSDLDACLATYGNDIHTYARYLLGLTEDEASYMFQGAWCAFDLPAITKKDAVRYLSKALKKKDIFVEI